MRIKKPVAPVVHVQNEQHMSLMNTLRKHSSQLQHLDIRTGILEDKMTTVQEDVRSGNKDTAEILSLVKAGKLGAHAIQWIVGVGGSVAVIGAAVHRFF